MVRRLPPHANRTDEDRLGEAGHPQDIYKIACDFSADLAGVDPGKDRQQI